MFSIKILILVFLICLPVISQGATLHYALDVQINTSEQKINVSARLKTNTDNTIRLFLPDLGKFKVDNKPVTTATGESIDLTFQSGQEKLISYEAVFEDKETNFIDKENVFLNGDWYPRPNVLAEYTLSVTLPNNFIATSEAEAVTVKEHGETKTYHFQFKHPLDTLHLAASSRYVLKKDRYKDVIIEAYFFKEDAQLIDTYIAHTKRYLKIYEDMLTPYPYRRFAIVENIISTGYSMPTYTLLGSKVLNLPFIVKTSLGHEILHQWFGNYVYIDFAHGNWAEGITNYLADHYYAYLEGKDSAYRKQIMVNYDAYVNENNTMPVSNFLNHRNKAQSAVGYGKAAMLFHDLKKRYGDKTFFASIREFIKMNCFREASWHDIQRAFEKITGDNLYAYFDQWLNRKDIPRLDVGNAELSVEQGHLKMNFTLLQQVEPYQLRLPITLYNERNKKLCFVEVRRSKEKISLMLDEPPAKVVIDEDYALMRQLAPQEIPPVLAGIMGKEKLIAVISAEQHAIYRPLIEATGVKNITYVSPDKISSSMIKENSFIIAGYDNPIIDMLFGKQSIPTNDVRLRVYKNPYNEKERIMLLHVKTRGEAQAVQRKISHYGKYTELAFDHGKNTHKAIADADKGITVLTQPTTMALKPDRMQTLEDILPELIESRIIHVGEQHDKFIHHINQLQIIKRIHEAGYKLAVGMEMFQKPFQKDVNDYMAGRIDERTFLKKTEYFHRWRYNYNLYKPIIDYLKQKNIPLIALNIKGDINRKVAHEGLHSLTDEEKKHLPHELDFSDDQYRRDLSKVFTLHKDNKNLRDFNYFLQAQILWDETMAESAQQFLKDNPGHKLVVLAGNGHIRHKYGIPERLYRRNQESFKVVVQDEDIEDGIADYVLVTTEIKSQKSPGLGVMVEEKEQSLVVTGVIDKSPANIAGLQKGDLIKTFAGEAIKSFADLKLALFYSETGSTQKIQIERDGKILNKKIELFSFTPIHHRRQMGSPQG